MDSLASIPAQAPDIYVGSPSPKVQILAIAGSEIAEPGPCAFIEGHGQGSLRQSGNTITWYFKGRWVKQKGGKGKTGEFITKPIA